MGLRRILGKVKKVCGLPPKFEQKAKSLEKKVGGLHNS